MEDKTIEINSYSEPKQVEQNSLETIALTFSGGGFRATAFGLGVLDYFYRLGLLHKVVYMASASGGSILTMKYALCQAQSDGEEFYDDFREDMRKLMQGCDLLNASLKTLKERNAFYKDNKPNLINSFAYQYNKTLYYNNTIVDLKTKSGHLQELCINCSDLTTGLPFRGIIFFDHERYFIPNSRFGNSIVQLRGSLINKLRLSDLVAASSCFPMGFEPMILCNDFAYGDECTSEYIVGNTKIDERVTTYGEYKDIFDNREIALIDGGVTDNTAIDSLIKSDEAREKLIKDSKRNDIKMYDFIMVNDVGSFNISAPIFRPRKSSILGLLNLRNLFSVICTGIVVFLVILTDIFKSWKTYVFHQIQSLHISWLDCLGQFEYKLIFSVVLFLLFFNFFFFRQQILLRLFVFLFPSIKIINFYSFSRFTDFLLTTKIKYYQDMALDRVKVGRSLLSEAFLNRIKKLNLESINNNPRYSSRKKCNNIIDLSTSMRIYNYDKQKEYDYSPLEISMLNDNIDAMIAIADKVSKMPTTLWFESKYLDENYLDQIIACGQFTTCHNLLEYFFKYKCLQTKYPEIFQVLKADFEQFKINPLFLHSKNLKL